MTQPSPRIGLDLLCLHESLTGMSWQAWWLARLLPAIAPDLTFVHFLPAGAEPPADAPNVEIVRLRLPSGRGSRVLGEQWHLPHAARRARLDLLHTIAYGSPWLYRGRKLLTIHDLAFLVEPDAMPARWRAYWTWACGRGADGCAGYITVSEATRADMVRLLGRDPASIHVVPPGVDDRFFRTDSDAAGISAIDRLGLPPHFMLSVGTIQPRKDIGTLLETFAALAHRHADLNLVLAGSEGWGYPDLAERIDRLGIMSRVRRLGYIDDAARPALYRAARVLVMTSRYEGFGLPIIEAMASGTPVVATDVSAIPEVAGDAALLAPVGDHATLASHVHDLLTDSRLRESLIERGRRRAGRFRWEESARRTAEVYRSHLDRSSRRGAH